MYSNPRPRKQPLDKKQYVSLCVHILYKHIIPPNYIERFLFILTMLFSLLIHPINIFINLSLSLCQENPPFSAQTNNWLVAQKEIKLINITD